MSLTGQSEFDLNWLRNMGTVNHLVSLTGHSEVDAMAQGPGGGGPLFFVYSQSEYPECDFLPTSLSSKLLIRNPHRPYTL